jgi:hypothetical protein
METRSYTTMGVVLAKAVFSFVVLTRGSKAAPPPLSEDPTAARGGFASIPGTVKKM